MVIYFKPDKNNKLHFLYCSSIRLNGENIDKEVLKNISHKIKNTPLNIDNNYSRPIEIKLV